MLMAAELPEDAHPTGRELTELERCLFCFYLNGTEAKHCIDAIAGHDDRKHDAAFVFTLTNHALILINKLLEVWIKFCSQRKADERVKKLIESMRPAVERLRSWAGIEAFRNQALAHGYRTKSSKVVHPTALLRSGSVPLQNDETMHLLLLCKVLSTAVIVFFAAEFGGIRPLLENYPLEPADPRAMNSKQREQELHLMGTQLNSALAALGVDLGSPLFGLFS